jgi:hypothetical protein
MIMRKALTLTIVVLLAFAGGCKQNQSEQTVAETGQTQATQNAHELTPEQLGELGAQIRKDPGRADALLGQHGLTRDSFESQIRKITENPDASKRYSDAYKKASS